jgi:hypothetical protein
MSLIGAVFEEIYGSGISNAEGETVHVSHKQHKINFHTMCIKINNLN